MAKRRRKLSAEEIEQNRIDRLAAQGEVSELIKQDAEDRAEEVPQQEETAAVPTEPVNTDAIEEPTDEVDGEKVNNSVVAAKFKDKYLANARLLGIPGKAAKRSNWDWLSQQIASYCLDDKHKIDISKFLSILDANMVDHSKWTNRNKGWEGRLRMTGRVALQKVVANNEALILGENTLVPPADFIARFKTKE